MYFSDFKKMIKEIIKPEQKKIDLLTKGKYLKGDKLSLAELDIQDGQTVTV